MFRRVAKRSEYKKSIGEGVQMRNKQQY